MKRILSIVIAVITYQISVAQQFPGGKSTYDFLALSPSARITALGGSNITLVDHDLSVQLDNPAALNPLMNRQATFGTSIYPGHINFGNLAYAQKFKVPGTFGFGLQYVAYGKFKETDEYANELGTFTASEMNFYAGYGYQFGKLFSVGVNTKFIYSNFDKWTSVGMAGDLSAMLNDTARNFTVTISAKNIGGQFNPYVKGQSREPIPFDLRAGFGFGFKHVPFHFHIMLHHLQSWDIRYDDPAQSAADNFFLDSSQLKPKKYIVDKIFRHIIIGMEINIKKVVRIEIAYNHLRQKELSLITRRSIPGISFGLGLHIKQFDFSYGLQPMAQGGALNYFTLSVNTAGFVKRKTVPNDPQKM